MGFLTELQSDDIDEPLDHDVTDRSMSHEGEPERTGADLAVVASLASVALSLNEFFVKGNRERGIFVGLWAPTILGFSSYLKQKAIEERLEESLVAGSTVRGIRNFLQQR